MDDLVRQAMAKWPHVPDCYGWLGLDMRGNWYLRDDRAQAAGTFASGVPGAKGSLLQHEKLIEFIARNYAPDASGRWYFQNGPQRVYVELQVTPWVWRLQPDGTIHSHTGLPTECLQALADEYGWLYLSTPLGLGLVHTQDMEAASHAVEAGKWRLELVQREGLAARFNYQTSPGTKSLGGV